MFIWFFFYKGSIRNNQEKCIYIRAIKAIFLFCSSNQYKISSIFAKDIRIKAKRHLQERNTKKKKNLAHAALVLNAWPGDEELNSTIRYLMLKIFPLVCDLSTAVIPVLRRPGQIILFCAQLPCCLIIFLWSISNKNCSCPIHLQYLGGGKAFQVSFDKS